ncbi:hypothetical protein [Zooshikella harenae]|uniref:SMI1/KNR4 family protein n=1 Tax=Zooshikella harenae TaxID=2827238 RepID=A0ABS5ZGL5_9GAMM|nr:hypothetical protein [Zooshikella harenae]MBU2713192.1 hypothetical protein [Zooshikella harenae]
MNKFVVSFDKEPDDISLSDIKGLRALFPEFRNLPPSKLKKKLVRWRPYIIGSVSESNLQPTKEKANELNLNLSFRSESDYGSALILSECDCNPDYSREYILAVFLPSFGAESVMLFERVNGGWVAKFSTMQASIHERYFLGSSFLETHSDNYQLYSESAHLSDDESVIFSEYLEGQNIKNLPEDNRIGCDGINIYLQETGGHKLNIWSPSAVETPCHYKYIKSLILAFSQLEISEKTRGYIKAIQRYIN